jgi:hypothetical protein
MPIQRSMIQKAPWPNDLEQAVDELEYLPGWEIWLSDESRGQGCSGLTLSIVPNKQDSYHPDQHARTRFIYPVPAASFNRESWEEWLWARIEETEGHERAEWFRFKETVEVKNKVGIPPPDGVKFVETRIRRPFKPAHADGWDPGVVRSVVSDTVTNTPNAGRLVQYPCLKCKHDHRGKMGEHFRIEEDRGCTEEKCHCPKGYTVTNYDGDGNEIDMRDISQELRPRF